MLFVCPERLGSWSLTPLSLSLQRERFLAGEFSLGTEQCQLGRQGGVDKMKLFFFPFLCSYFQLLCSTVLLKFLKCTPALFLFMERCLIVDLCWRMEAEVSYSTILVTLLWLNNILLRIFSSIFMRDISLFFACDVFICL